MSNVWSGVVRLGADAETRDVGTTTVTSFNGANSVYIKGNNETLWVQVSYWGKRGEGACQYLTKGKEVFVSGELTREEYNDKVYLKLNCNSLDFVGGKGDGGESKTPDMKGDNVPF